MDWRALEGKLLIKHGSTGSLSIHLLHLRSSSKFQVTSELHEVHYEKPQGSEKRDEGYQALYTAIGELPHLDRLIIMMVLEELPYEDIASIIGISMVNVRVKIHRIKNTCMITSQVKVMYVLNSGVSK